MKRAAATEALELIRAERATHASKGYTPDRDRAQGAGPLLRAGRAYETGDERSWPWDMGFWKPRSHVENLLRAGALYMAAQDTFGAGYEHYVVRASHLLQAELDGARAVLYGKARSTRRGLLGVIRRELERQQEDAELYVGEYNDHEWVVDGRLDVHTLAEAVEDHLL